MNEEKRIIPWFDLKQMNESRGGTPEENILQVKKRITPEAFNRFVEGLKNGKRFSKHDMAFMIGLVDPHDAVALYYDHFSREEVLEKFNKYFGDNILGETNFTIVSPDKDDQNRDEETQIRDVGRENSYNPEKDTVMVDPDAVMENKQPVTEAGGVVKPKYPETKFDGDDWVTIFTQDLLDDSFSTKPYLKWLPYNKAVKGEVLTDADAEEIINTVIQNRKTYDNPSWIQRAQKLIKNALGGKIGLEYNDEDMTASVAYNRASGAGINAKMQLQGLIAAMSKGNTTDAINKLEHLYTNKGAWYKRQYELEDTGEEAGSTAKIIGDVDAAKEGSETSLDVVLDQAIQAKDRGALDNIKNLISKYSDTRRGQDLGKAPEKQYVDANKLLEYGVVINDPSVVDWALQIKASTPLDPSKSGRGEKGKFQPQLINKLLKLAAHPAIIKKLKEIKIRMQLGETKVKRLIVTERQAQMLALLKLEESAAIDATKGNKSFNYKSTRRADITKNMNKTDYAEKLKDERERNQHIAPQVTKKELKYRSPSNRNGSMIVKGGKIKDHEKRPNSYYVHEGTVLTKKELIEKILKK